MAWAEVSLPSLYILLTEISAIQTKDPSQPEVLPIVAITTFPEFNHSSSSSLFNSKIAQSAHPPFFQVSFQVNNKKLIPAHRKWRIEMRKLFFLSQLRVSCGLEELKIGKRNPFKSLKRTLNRKTQRGGEKFHTRSDRMFVTLFFFFFYELVPGASSFPIWKFSLIFFFSFRN